MPLVELEHVSKRFGATSAPAVDDLSLTIADGHFVCLLGPSGCGKSTTLRMIAGLEVPTDGEIRLDGRVLSSGRTGEFMPPERRGLGLVFQSYALWPHMTVAQNVAFGLEMRGWKRAQRTARVRELLELLHIAGLDSRYPLDLSGGEQQRVALARMLAVNPALLLLDEPLSNLDARLRLEMRAELKRLHEQLGNTIVFVTHDQLEAMTMATEIAVMHDGRLLQFGPPMEIYHSPATLFVAEFVGNPPMNLFTVGDHDSAQVAGGLLDYLERRCGVGRRDLARAGTVGVRPESIGIVSADATAATERWARPATVEAILPTGPQWIVRLRLERAVVFALTVQAPAFGTSSQVGIVVEARDLHLFGSDGQRLSDISIEFRQSVEV